MQEHCRNLAQSIFTKLPSNEFCQIGFSGEDSNFLRFNHGKVRQVGQVRQLIANLALRNGKKQTQAQLTLTTDFEVDQKLLRDALIELRNTLAYCDDDPFLDEPPTKVQQASVKKEPMPEVSHVFELLLAHCPRGELVGFIASGSLMRGLFTSSGTLHWYEANALNCDWSIYLRADRAVKAGFAGTLWDENAFITKCRATTAQFDLLQLPSITLKPGKFRVFLTPSALVEIFDLLGGHQANGTSSSGARNASFCPDHSPE